MAKTIGSLEGALGRFLEVHLCGLDTASRTAALAEYARGLSLELGDKSMVGMARSLAPDNVQGCRQRTRIGHQLKAKLMYLGKPDLFARGAHARPEGRAS